MTLNTSDELLDIKKRARDYVDRKNYRQAAELIEQTILRFPQDITLYELLDYFFYLNKNIAQKERLEGRLRAVNGMLALNPDDHNDVYDEANYSSGLYFEKANILGILVLEKENVQDLKESMDAFQTCIDLHGGDFWVLDSRRAVFDLAVRAVGPEEIERVFPNYVEMRLAFLDEVIEADNLNKGDRIIEKAIYLMEILKFEQAINCYYQALELKPKDYLWYRKTAECYLALEEYGLAIDECKKIPPDYPHQGDRALLEARAYARLHDYGMAIDKLKEYGIAEYHVGIKGSVRSHEDFIEIWDDPQFLKLTYASSLDMEFVEDRRNKIRKKLNK